MNVSKINSTQTPAAQKGKKVGKFVGAGVGTAYIVKNAKDIFVQCSKNATEQLGNQKLKYEFGKLATVTIRPKDLGYIIAAGVSLATITATKILGKTAGYAIGKAIDNHHEKQAQKQAINE